MPKSSFSVIKYFYKIAKKYRPSYFLWTLGDILLKGIAPFVGLVWPKFLIDELTIGKRIEVIIALIGIFLVVNFLISLLNNARDYQMQLGQFVFDRKLNEALSLKAMEIDFEQTEDPEVLNQLEKAKNGLRQSGGIPGINQSITSMISGILLLLGSLYIIILLSLWIIALSLCILFINAILAAKRQKTEIKFQKELSKYGRTYSYYLRLLKNFLYGKDIRLYNACDLILNRLYQDVINERTIYKNIIAKRIKFGSIQSLLYFFQTAFLYIYLGLRVFHGLITIGDLWMLLRAAQTFSGGLGLVVSSLVDINTKAEYLKEYVSFMENKASKESGVKNLDSKSDLCIEVRNLYFTYPKRDEMVLNGISLKIPYGQRLAIVGPNGAGKTTFVKLLTRLYDPTQGEIMINGTDIKNYKLEEYRKLFSVVFQDYKLLAFSIKENVVLDSPYDENQLNNVINMAGISDKVTSLKLGLDTPLDKSFDKDGVNLSEGENQKIAIARAIYRNSLIVILDEPTASLDPIAESEVYTSFDKLIGNKTAIYLSHRLSSCCFCDKIAVFDKGKIVEYGSHEELLKMGGLYSKMWNAQAQWYVSDMAGI